MSINCSLSELSLMTAMQISSSLDNKLLLIVVTLLGNYLGLFSLALISRSVELIDRKKKKISLYAM